MTTTLSSGGPWWSTGRRAAKVADVAVADGLIERWGGRGMGDREVDASGLVLAPGWVDIHTHYDGQVTWDPGSALELARVTTVVMGNCGVGFAPVRPEGREFLIELMEGVETSRAPRSMRDPMAVGVLP